MWGQMPLADLDAAVVLAGPVAVVLLAVLAGSCACAVAAMAASAGPVVA